MIQKLKILDGKVVFVLKFIEYIFLRRPISHIDQSNLKTHKKKVVYSLLEFCGGIR